MDNPSTPSVFLLLFCLQIPYFSLGKRIEFDDRYCYQETPGNVLSSDFPSNHITLSSSPVNVDRPISIQIKACPQENGFGAVMLKAQPTGYYFSKTNPVKLGSLLDTEIVCGIDRDSQVKHNLYLLN